jgi:hypothetical protein
VIGDRRRRVLRGCLTTPLGSTSIAKGYQKVDVKGLGRRLGPDVSRSRP